MKPAMTQSPPDAAPPVRKRKTKARQEPQERPRVGGVRAISDLMPAIGGAAFRKFGFIQSSIVTRWGEIAGERHAALSMPESIRFPAGKKSDGTLHLVVASGHAPIIQHVIPDLIGRVNRFFGYAAISRIVLRQGQVKVTAPTKAPPPRMLRPVPAEVGEGIREIADPELRAVLEALAGGVAGTNGVPRIS
jgi:hypothetical protein